MPRIDTAARDVTAAPARVYAAFIDPAALEVWLPPRDMTGVIEHFDARVGGGYRMVLNYLSGDAGKTGNGSDLIEGRFVEFVPDERVVHEVEFVSDDPAFAGTMRMTWSAEPLGSGSRVRMRAENVPSGISAAAHAVGLASSLGNLAAYLDR